MHMRLNCKLRLIGVRCRLTNIGNTSLVLDDITLDYWFNGPADSSVSVDQFRPVCSDTTIGELSDCQHARHTIALLCCAVLCCFSQTELHAVLRYAVPCCAALFKQQIVNAASQPTHTTAFPLSLDDCTEWQVMTATLARELGASTLRS